MTPWSSRSILNCIDVCGQSPCTVTRRIWLAPSNQPFGSTEYSKLPCTPRGDPTPWPTACRLAITRSADALSTCPPARSNQSMKSAVPERISGKANCCRRDHPARSSESPSTYIRQSSGAAGPSRRLADTSIRLPNSAGRSMSASIRSSASLRDAVMDCRLKGTSWPEEGCS